MKLSLSLEKLVLSWMLQRGSQGSCNQSLDYSDYYSDYSYSEFFQGCDINHVSDSGRTALWKAAQCDYREVVLFLHHRGATVNNQTKVGASLLHEMTRQV